MTATTKVQKFSLIKSWIISRKARFSFVQSLWFSFTRCYFTGVHSIRRWVLNEEIHYTQSRWLNWTTILRYFSPYRPPQKSEHHRKLPLQSKVLRSNTKQLWFHPKDGNRLRDLGSISPDTSQPYHLLAGVITTLLPASKSSILYKQNIWRCKFLHPCKGSTNQECNTQLTLTIYFTKKKQVSFQRPITYKDQHSKNKQPHDCNI